MYFILLILFIYFYLFLFYLLDTVKHCVCEICEVCMKSTHYHRMFCSYKYQFMYKTWCIHSFGANRHLTSEVRKCFSRYLWRKKCNDAQQTLFFDLCKPCLGYVRSRVYVKKSRRLLIKKWRHLSMGSRAKRITEKPVELAGIAGYSYTPPFKLC